MRLISFSEIAIASNRQRREFPADSINELRESLESNGLFHPIVIRTHYDPNQQGNTIYTLVAGERRLRAISDIWSLGGSFSHDGRVCGGPEVPCVDLGELDALSAEEAELEENIRREDLTWQERAEATNRLHRLRANQATARGEVPPTIAQTAVEIRGSSFGDAQENTRKEILIAQHLDDPEVRAAKTLKEGFKALKRKETAERNLALAESMGATFSSKSHTALCEDALSWLVEAPAESFDVILTDPPYGMGADEFGDSGGRTAGEHGYTDNALDTQKLLANCAEYLFRVAKPQAHLYMFCDIDMFFFLRDLFEATGWWVHRTPIIWNKPSAARIPWPEHGPQRKWEMLLYAVKGKRTVTRIAPDLVTYPPDANLGHQAQKPVNLFIDLLSRSIHPGDRVLDPFMGTGTIFPAAHEVKCIATGIERDPASYGIALARLNLLDKQLNLEI